MRARLLLLALAVGCTAPPPAKKPTPIVPTHELIEAFHKTIQAHYELQLLAEPDHRSKQPERDLEVAKANEKRAREQLVEALVAAGSREAKSGPDQLSELIPILKEALIRTGRYAFVFESEKEKDLISLQLVRLAQPPQARSIEIFGQTFEYELYLHDRTVIEDYATYRAARLGKGAAVLRPALTFDKRVYIDLEAAAAIGREKFFPRVAGYRELARAAAASDEPFVAEAENIGRLFGLTKDVLRWRSLETWWATVQSQPAEEQARAFAENFRLHAEVAAACEAFELAKASATGAPHPTGDKLVALEERRCLEAIVHGEPLGAMADVVALAAECDPERSAGADPFTLARLQAAGRVTVAIVHQIAAPGRPKTNAQEAKDCARLARASGEEIRSAARAVYERLVAAAKPPG